MSSEVEALDLPLQPVAAWEQGVVPLALVVGSSRVELPRAGVCSQRVVVLVLVVLPLQEVGRSLLVVVLPQLEVLLEQGRQGLLQLVALASALVALASVLVVLLSALVVPAFEPPFRLGLEPSLEPGGQPLLQLRVGLQPSLIRLNPQLHSVRQDPSLRHEVRLSSLHR